jgi:ubiquinone/menaquinone biosynthesis C-methylase UbiE
MGKMRMFLRQSTVGREPLAIAMSGVRMGERVLQIGMDTPLVTSLLAAKPGLSGESAMVLADEATAMQARRAVAESGALVNLTVHPLHALPFDRGTFDLVVVHNRNGQTLTPSGQAERLSEWRRVLRSGGRLVVINKGSPSGMTALFQSRPDPGQTDSTLRALQAAGFRSVRELGDRDGYVFIEGLNVERTD